MSTEQLKTAIVHREEWGRGREPFTMLETALNENKVSHMPRFWSGLRMDWWRFAMMGPVVLTCPFVHVFGRGDEEKRFCWPAQPAPPCVVFSIGSNNQWGFETDIIANSNCVVHVFDCTVAHPTPPASTQGRLFFYSACIGSAPGFYDLIGLTKLAHAVPTLLKMDIEGFEWEVLTNIMETSARHRRDTGEDIFPQQIAVEMHYFEASKLLSSYGRDRSPGEMFMYFQRLFQFGGYVLAERRDNMMCAFCSEILLVRAACPTYV